MNDHKAWSAMLQCHNLEVRQKKEEKKTGPLVDSCMPGGTQKPNGKRNCEKKEREGIQEIDAERLIKFFLN